MASMMIISTAQSCFFINIDLTVMSRADLIRFSAKLIKIF